MAGMQGIRRKILDYRERYMLLQSKQEVLNKQRVDAINEALRVSKDMIEYGKKLCDAGNCFELDHIYFKVGSLETIVDSNAIYIQQLQKRIRLLEKKLNIKSEEKK